MKRKSYVEIAITSFLKQAAAAQCKKKRVLAFHFKKKSRIPIVLFSSLSHSSKKQSLKKVPNRRYWGDICRWAI